MSKLGAEMDITKSLAAFAAELSYEAIPPAVRERCRMSVLDGLGVMLGAVGFARDEGDCCLAAYLEAAARDGPCTIVGHGRRADPLLAAFANGTLSEVLDCQDTNLTARVHNGSPIIPAALALAEARGHGWRDLVTAIVAGYEVHTRLLLTIQPSHWYRGFQATGTFGTSGAAVAAGRLLALDARGLAQALGISGFVMPISSGDNQFKGYSIKPVHGGQAAMCGISSALLAKAGYEAGPLEGEPPRYHAALPILSDGPKLARALEGLGETWHTLEVAYKPYPIGHLIVGPVELVLDVIRPERRIDPDEVEMVEIATFRDAVTFTGRKYTTPESGYIDAHLSIPFCVAAALIHGRLTPQELSRRALRDPAVHELAARVRVEEDPLMTAAFPDTWPAEMMVRLAGGEFVTRRVDAVKWSPKRPPAWEELAAKFHVMADPVIGAGRAGEAIDLLRRAEGDERLTALYGLVRPAQRHNG